jgi:hypothetical protein
VCRGSWFSCRNSCALRDSWEYAQLRTNRVALPVEQFHFVNEAGTLLAIDADGASSLVRSCCAGRALRRPPKAILKRIQKSDYLGFLKISQRIERVPHTRRLPSVPLNGVIVGK